MTEVFLDTAYVIALTVPSDQYHESAKQLAVWVEREKVPIITTRAILLKIGNALSKQRFRQKAVALLTLIEDDSAIEIVSMSDNLYRKALILFQQRSDQEWGLVDCVSCIAMQERDVREVLTADRHFQQMGFRTLLSEV